MRRIISKQQESQKRKRNQLIAGGILIMLMVFSILGYSFQGKVVEDSQNEEVLNYNGFNFVLQNGVWILNFPGMNRDFVFAYNPEQVEEIPVNKTIKNLNNYLQRPLYISSPDIMAEAEIRNNMLGFVERIQSSCYEEDCQDKNLPTKTCRDNFIIIKESNKTEILQKDNCVFMQGKKEELVMLADRFLFAVLEID